MEKKKNAISTKSAKQETKKNKNEVIDEVKNDVDSNIQSPIEKYYESILLKSYQLFEQGEYEKALEIIEDELDAPYIPLKQFNDLEDLANNIRQQIVLLNRNEDYEVMNQKQLFNKVFENDVLNQTALMMFFEKYKDVVTEEELLTLEDALASKKLTNNDKILIFSAFKNSDINRNVKIYNSFLKEEFYVNTIKTLNFFEFKSFKRIEKLINDMSSKEPSILNFCIAILEMIYIYNFPQEPNYDPELLALSLFEYMFSALNGSNKKTNREIFNYIDNIIKKMQS